MARGNMKMKRLLLLSAIAAALSTGASAAPLGQADVVWKLSNTTSDAKVYDSVKMPNGDIVIVGNKLVTDHDLWAVRIDPNGNVVWTVTYPKPGAAGDVFPVKAALSPTGDVYLACEVTGNVTVSDYWFVVLSPTGAMVNDRVVNEFPNDQVGDMKVGVGGNVLFCGHGLSPDQPVVVKLDPALNTDWLYNFGNPAAVIDQSARSIDVDVTGQVLVGGTVDNGGQIDIGLDRLDPLGVPIYSKTIGDPAITDRDPKVFHATTGATYLTYVRAAAALTSVGRIAKFDPAGVFQWNFDEPLLDFTAAAEMPGGDIAFAGSDDDAPFRSKYYRLTPAGALVWSQFVPTPNVGRNLMDHLAVGPDGTITSFSHIEVLGKPGADWLVNSLSPSGVELYQWTFDTGVGNFDIPSGIVAMPHGGVIVHGFMNLAGLAESHVFRLQPYMDLAPDTASVKRGRQNSGNLASLQADDNDFFEVCKFIVPNASTPPVNVEFEATVPSAFPSGSLTFGVIAKGSTPNLSAETEVFNWTTGLFERAVTTPLGLAESNALVVCDPATQIEAGTGRVKSRVRVKATGPTATNLWCVRFDRATWRLSP